MGLEMAKIAGSVFAHFPSPLIYPPFIHFIPYFCLFHFLPALSPFPSTPITHPHLHQNHLLQMHTSSPSLTSSSPTPTELPQIQRSTAELVEILIYSFCLLIGGPLNLFSFRKLLLPISRPSSNIRASFGTQIALLKLHLNIADLITMFIYTLSQIIWMISYQWHAGDLMCRICKFFHTFGFYLNSFVVACFAIDRFLGTRNLNNPSGPTVAHRRVKRMLSVAWLLAFLLSLPQCFIFRVFEPSELSNFKQCTPIWTILGYELDVKLGTMKAGGREEVEIERRRKELVEQFQEVLKWERAYNLAHLLFVFWIPTFITVVSYACILITLNSLSVVPQSIRRTGASFRQRRPRCGTFTNTINNNEDGKEMEWKERRKSTEERAARNGSGRTIGGEEVDGRESGEMGRMEEEERTEEGARRRKSNGSAKKVGALAAQTIAKARQNAKRQAALILAAYLAFWSPYNLLAIINIFSPKEGTVREISSITLPFLNSLIVVNPIVNPLIYGVFEYGRK